MQIEKPNLGHHRKVVSEGDVESREAHRRFSRPKRKVKHMQRQGKLMTVRKVGKSKSFTQMNQSGKWRLSGEGARYVNKEGAVTL